ncbi:MAG: adenylosuccinate synthase [Bacilli bacterium]
MNEYRTVAVEGSQFGDEGKGKITDFIASTADVVCRYQGGNNAGHTVEINGVKHALRSLPSGIYNPNVNNVIANGVVVNPFALLDEIDENIKSGLKDFHLHISNRAHLIMPYHIELDKAYEEAMGKNAIGTTKRGIGPCYADKAKRIGIRVGDLLHPGYLHERLESALAVDNIELKAFGKATFDVETLFAQLLKAAERLKPFITDTSVLLNDYVDEGKKVVFEGAQGSLLDLDHGTYPFVTSSSPTSISIPLNAGIAPQKINKVMAVMKAYMTRVGAGPMPTEQTNSWGDNVREKGHEYGVVTHRPRRVGYLDLVLLGYTFRITGVTDIACMLFDVLEDIDDLKVCVAYELDGKEIHYVPSSEPDYARCKPIYKEFKTIPSFDKNSIHKISDLPIEAQDYLSFIEKTLNAKISILSLGPDREDTVIINPIF